MFIHSCSMCDIVLLYSPDVRCEEGWRVGFGIHYNPAESCKPDFDDKKQQLVLCFVTLDMQIVFFRMMIQPSGGFYPLVILTRGGSSDFILW